MNILITGGAGFIGSHTVRHFLKRYPHYKIINLDKLTYAGNLSNLRDIESLSNYVFIKGDINDQGLLNEIFTCHDINAVIHLAAESHVDRSISGPEAFVQTNVLGTMSLLNACRTHWQDFTNKKFYHISTDEVFGSLGSSGYFNEATPYDPRSPYSASKAASDHLVRAYHHTYKLPVLVSNCSNNFGTHHFPEKLIPLIIHNIRHNKPLPIYGKGENIRDWLWVEDHARAIDVIFHHGTLGETYCIGGTNEWKNIDLVKLICRLMDEKLSRPAGTNEGLIQFVSDRPGHDARYAIDSSKLQNELGWKATGDFKGVLAATIDWYLNHNEWLEQVTSGEYMKYYDSQYKLG
jgi:dTDP-glucose 4,6-dehydratase